MIKHQLIPSRGNGFPRSCLHFLFRDAAKLWRAMPRWGQWDGNILVPPQQWEIWSPCQFFGEDNGSSAPAVSSVPLPTSQICHLPLLFLAAKAGSVPYILQTPTPPIPSAGLSPSPQPGSRDEGTLQVLGTSSQEFPRLTYASILHMSH